VRKINCKYKLKVGSFTNSGHLLKTGFFIPDIILDLVHFYEKLTTVVGGKTLVLCTTDQPITTEILINTQRELE
jgi:hypothetical protein